MGCNCKKQVDKINEKYGNGGEEKNNLNPLAKIIQFIAQMFFGIFCGAIIIIMLIPIIIYIILCIMFGKQPRFNIKSLNMYLNKTNN